MHDLLPLLVVVCVTAAGIVTGLLFAFSNFALRALADLPDAHGMFAMQQINARIQNPLFLVLFLGTPLLCVAIAVLTAGSLAAPGRLALFAGAVAYLVGPFGITVLFNVPLNNRLANTSADDAARAWPAYRRQWQRWNHIRTALGVLSLLLLAGGLARV
ncbi:MAG: DUF1772 domain-containing protein [Gammaproteobacteria bacterium]|nr:DUF1772 domain-containing protein [Gammaproteobacteria bacterium]